MILYILTLSLLVLSTFYGFYFIFGVFYGRHEDLNKYAKSNYMPTVSLVIATYNEEKIIYKKIQNILDLEYPPEKLEIIFVDCSNDKTKEIIEQFKQESAFNIKIIHEPTREGLPHALNLGYSNASGDVVIKSDCDIILMRDSIKAIVNFLGDKSVGCVSGIGIADNDLEAAYRNTQTKLRIAESNLYSTYLFDTFCCFRRSLIEPLEFDSMADDAELSLKIIRKGYKSLLNPKAKFYENCASSFGQRRKQKDRRAEGHIRLILKNIDLLFNPKLGKFGFMIFPSIFFMMVISPWIIMAALITGFITSIQLFRHYSLIFLLIIPLLIFIAFRAPFLAVIGSFIDSQLSLIIAQLRIASGKHAYIWNKIERTA